MAVDFTPLSGNTNTAVNGGPSAAAGSGNISFTPIARSTPMPAAPQAGNPFVQAGEGALNFINNNPISKSLTSLAALPVQGVAAAMHQPDPFANGIGSGPAAPQVTTTDQPSPQLMEQEAGNVLTAGSLLTPVGGVAEAGASALSHILPEATAGVVSRIGTMAGLGAVQGLGSGMQSGQNPSQLKGSAAIGATLGGGLATAGELGSALVDNFANTTGTSRLESQTNNLKTLQRAFADSSTRTTNPITTMEQNGIIKDLRVVDGKVNIENITNPAGTGSLDNLIQDQQDMGTQAVGQMNGGIKTDDFKNAVIESVQNNAALKASGNVSKIVTEVGRRFDDYTESYGDDIPYKDVNAIRVAMNKNWDPDTWDAEKAIGNAARTILYNGSGAGTTLKSAMANEQELINAKEFAQKLGGTAVKGGRLGKYIADLGAGIVGGIAGSTMGPVGTGIGAAAAGATADKLMGIYQSNYFNPVMGGAAQGLRRFIGSPAASAVTGVAKPLLITSAVKQ